MERMIKNFGEDALSIENIWNCFLNLMEEENFTKAFEVLLRFGDDFYFLRACLMGGGQILKKLHKRVSLRVLRRICQIRLAGNLDTLSMHFIERGVRNNYLDRVDYTTNCATIESLEAIGGHFNHVIRDRADYLKNLVSKLIDLN